MRLPTFSLVLLLATSAHAESIFNRGQFEGWHFYRERLPAPPVTPVEPPPPPMEEPEPKEPEEPLPEEPVVSVPLPTPPPAPKTEQPPAQGSVAWLRDALPKMLDIAVDNPTPENIRMYAYLQRLAIDKSDVFSALYETVMQSDPVLNENSLRPRANFMIDYVADRIKKNRVEVTKDILAQVPLVFFFSSSCEYCNQMASILDYARQYFGATVLPVSMDGKPLGVPLFTDYRVDDGHSHGLELPTLPAVYGYYPADKRWIPVLYGFHDSEDFKLVIIAMGYSLGLIDKDRYETTRTYDSKMLLEAKLPEQTEIPESFEELFKKLEDQNASPTAQQTLEALVPSPGKLITSPEGAPP